jgi:hypothetical protein
VVFKDGTRRVPFEEVRAFWNDGTRRVDPHPLPLPTRGRGFRQRLRLSKGGRGHSERAIPSPLWGGVGVGVPPLHRRPALLLRPNAAVHRHSEA